MCPVLEIRVIVTVCHMYRDVLPIFMYINSKYRTSNPSVTPGVMFFRRAVTIDRFLRRERVLVVVEGGGGSPKRNWSLFEVVSSLLFFLFLLRWSKNEGCPLPPAETPAIDQLSAPRGGGVVYLGLFGAGMCRHVLRGAGWKAVTEHLGLALGGVVGQMSWLGHSEPGNGEEVCHNVVIIHLLHQR